MKVKQVNELNIITSKKLSIKNIETYDEDITKLKIYSYINKTPYLRLLNKIPNYNEQINSIVGRVISFDEETQLIEVEQTATLPIDSSKMELGLRAFGKTINGKIIIDRLISIDLILKI